MTIQHVAIADADRHEAKGASTASINTFLAANGDGSTSFRPPNYSDLNIKPTSKGYLKILQGASTAANQAPTALNTIYQVEFGAAQATADVSLSAAGLVTFITAGYYQVISNFRFGRAALTGNAVIFTRPIYNGAALGFPASTTIADSNAIEPYAHSGFVLAAAGDTLLYQFIRDSTGVNAGGLYMSTPATSGWAASPSASITLSKFQGLA